MVELSCKNIKISTEINLTRSKSESNRALLLQAVLGNGITINNLSDSDDTKVLANALGKYNECELIDVGHAGTSFRFLTAFLASRPHGQWMLTGSDRMKERPIKVLVDALATMGADIKYLEKDGFPPLMIRGSDNLKSEVEIDAGVSSQYLSALMLIGANFKNGLKINIQGNIASLPYLLMTKSMLEEVNVYVALNEDGIEIKRRDLFPVSIEIEADWSAASYWYSIIALSEIGSIVKIKGLLDKSKQGDAAVKLFYEKLGVQSTFVDSRWVLEKTNLASVENLVLDLSNTPDIAQTLVCTCAGLGIGVNFTGLHTLRIKETDRLTALKTELFKFGIDVFIDGDDKLLMKSNQKLKKPVSSVATYKDHRMAMSFAPLAQKVDLAIENEEVVSKSYPNFWKDMREVLNVIS